MFSCLSLRLDQGLQLDISFLKHLLKSNLLLLIRCDGVAPLKLAFADDATSDGDSLLGWVVRDIVRAPALVTTAVVLV